MEGLPTFGMDGECALNSQANPDSHRRRSRRALLATSALVAALFLSSVGVDSPAAAVGDRSLSFFNTHTQERATITFKRNGVFDPEGLRRINQILRDWRRNEVIEMDRRLIDLVWEVYQESGSRQPISIICGYRAPATNAMLRSRSSGVAENSQHMLGKALDFFLPDVPLRKLRDLGLQAQIGGVGYYPGSGSPFIHLDVGSVRHWPGISRDQLVQVFPQGHTLHIPSDGRPLPGYQEAQAAYRSRGSGAPQAPDHENGAGGGTLVASLFGAGRTATGRPPAATPAAAATVVAEGPAAPAPRPRPAFTAAPAATAAPLSLSPALIAPPAPASAAAAAVSPAAGTGAPPAAPVSDLSIATLVAYTTPAEPALPAAPAGASPALAAVVVAAAIPETLLDLPPVPRRNPALGAAPVRTAARTLADRSLADTVATAKPAGDGLPVMAFAAPGAVGADPLSILNRTALQPAAPRPAAAPVPQRAPAITGMFAAAWGWDDPLARFSAAPMAATRLPVLSAAVTTRQAPFAQLSRPDTANLAGALALPDQTLARGFQRIAAYGEMRTDRFSGALLRPIAVADLTGTVRSATATITLAAR